VKDWDEARLAGVDIVRMMDNAAIEQANPPPKANGCSHNNVGASHFKLVQLDSVESESIEWMWDGYIAIGHMTLLAGDPDMGKSQIAIDVAARLSTGGHMPKGARVLQPSSTIFLCSEDSIADTIRPRAEAAGANLKRLHVLKSTVVKDGKEKTFTLQTDLDLLSRAVQAAGNVRLVVVDALTSYMGRVENNDTTDIRAVLDRVSEWAADHGVAIWGITHPPKAAQKNAIRQFTAYVAAARLALLAIAEPDTDRKLLLSAKNNIGPKPQGRGYRIATKEIGPSGFITAPYIQWDDAPVDYTADQAIAASSSRNSSLKEAKDFLSKCLADGPMDADEILAAAHSEMISEITLRRAKKELGVISKKKQGDDQPWMWSLTAA